MRHVYFDISWSEVAKYIVANSDSIRHAAEFVNRYQNRFLFGTTKSLQPIRKTTCVSTTSMAPLWSVISKEASARSFARETINASSMQHE
jgi:hypothetical protein